MYRLLAALFCFLLINSSAIGKPETLTVYTYRSFTSEWGPGPLIKKRFEVQCQCQIDYVVSDDSGTLISQIRLEGKETKADVIVGADYSLSAELISEKLIAPHNISIINLNLPNGWHDNYFVPYDYGYLAFIYDKNRLTNLPRTIKELAANKNLTVIYEDPRTSSLGLALLLWWNQIYGSETPALWKQLNSHTVSVTKGWSEAYGLFLSNEADLVLSYTTSPAYPIYNKQEDRYRAVIFEEGNFLQIEVAAVMSHAKHPKLAQQFLAFLLSEAVQTILPRTQWMLPVKEYGKLPEEFSKLEQPTKVIHITPQKTFDMRKQWIKQWLQNS